MRERRRGQKQRTLHQLRMLDPGRGKDHTRLEWISELSRKVVLAALLAKWYNQGQDSWSPVSDSQVPADYLPTAVFL